MREFLLNSENQLDRAALAFLDGAITEGLLPCREIRFNGRIKLGFFTEQYRSIGEESDRFSVDNICEFGISLLDRVKALESVPQISLENVVWDEESIYLDRRGRVFLTCLPAVLPEETLRSQIYIKRVYALLTELLQGRRAEELIKQIDYQQKKSFGDWPALQDVLERHLTEDDDDSLVLRSINTPRALRFFVGYNKYLIGTDASRVDGVITGVDSVNPVHAEIGWNEIGHYIRDIGSENGTYVNDQRISPNVEIPIGKGTVLRFADYTFNVE